MRWSDISGIRRMDNALGRLEGPQRHNVMRRAVNHTGDKARTVVTRTLAKQTGLPYRVIRRAIKVRRAFGATGRGSLDYVMSSVGGDVSLKYFRARETRLGVTAYPFGKRRTFVGSFIKAGRFPNRVRAKGLGGHVYGPDRSVKGWGRPVAMRDSGVIIPREMTNGETLEAFTTLVNRELPRRVLHEITFMLPGIFD
jgi:hypothetical protein